MGIIETIKEYWLLITFFVGEIGLVWMFVRSIIEGIKCSLRNDILEIYDKCKENQEVTKYQLQSITFSYDVYKKLRGNSFVDEIMKEVKTYKIID